MATDTKTMASEQGHWYDEEGNPAYEVPNKSKGGMRATTLRDAKVLNLFPSVTGISKQMSAPGLQAWILNQAYMSAYTCPVKRSDLSGEEWIALVRADAQAQAEQARQKGTEIHTEIEKGLSGGYVAPEHEARYLNVLDVLKNYKVDITLSEKSFTKTWYESDCKRVIGYGGKIDILSHNLVADIKTTEFTLNEVGKPSKSLIWPEHGLQLSAYAHGALTGPLKENHTLLNIYVSTITDDVVVHQWSEKDYLLNCKQFLLLTSLWWLRNI